MRKSNMLIELFFCMREVLCYRLRNFKAISQKTSLTPGVDLKSRVVKDTNSNNGYSYSLNEIVAKVNDTVANG